MVNRRDFMMMAAAGAAAFRTLPLSAQIGSSQSAGALKLPSKLEPFSGNEVHLREGLLLTRYNVNSKKIKEIPPEDILMPFFRSRGLPTSGKELNGDCLDRCQTGPAKWPGLQSAFWFSAAAATARWGNDTELQAQLVQIVRDLARTREPNGFLLASVTGLTDWDDHYSLTPRMRSMIHGLLDIYEATGDKLALDLARGQADCLWNEMQSRHYPQGNAYVQPGSIDMALTPVPHRLTLLDFISITERLTPAFTLLYQHTGDARYAEIARLCIDESFVKALVLEKPAHNDPLTGRHSGTTMEFLYSVHLLGQLMNNEQYVIAGTNAWNLISERYLYVTGGTGSRENWLPGAQSWQLPDTENAQESCAAAFWIFYNDVMLQWSGDAKYADHIEQTLYNNVLAAQDPDSGDVSYFLNLAGKDKLFDPPPRHGRHCCEGNLTYALASIPAMIYGKSKDGISINLYTPSELKTTLGSGTQVIVIQETDYPVKGEVNIHVRSSRTQRFALNLRIPSWCREAPRLEVNGAPVTISPSSGAYQVIDREWSQDDDVRLTLPMGPYVRHNTVGNISRVGLGWGPLVLAGTWEDGLPLAFDPPLPEFGARSSVNRVPFVPTLLVAEGDPVQAWSRVNEVEVSFEALAVSAASPTEFTAPVAPVKVRFQPFYAVTQGKYSVWFPAIRKT
jgi:DUF1680 family protein